MSWQVTDPGWGRSGPAPASWLGAVRTWPMPVQATLLLAACCGAIALTIGVATLLTTQGIALHLALSSTLSYEESLQIEARANFMAFAFLLLVSFWMASNAAPSPASAGFRSPLSDTGAVRTAVGAFLALWTVKFALVVSDPLSGAGPATATQATLPDAAHAKLLTLGIVMVLGPIAEEVLFRGVLLGGLMALGLRPMTALLISTAAFTAAHVHHEPVQLIGVFGIGLAFGWLFVRTRSLLAPVGLHVFHNAMVVVCAEFARYQIETGRVAANFFMAA
ncbi:MAG: type II CAAX endopeptidase family protein [Pseudomonadota bacterium]